MQNPTKDYIGSVSSIGQRFWRWFRSPDIIVSFIILLLFISGIAIYVSNKPLVPSFYITDPIFNLGVSKRSIEFSVKVEKGNIKLKDLFVNNDTVYDWSADKTIVKEGDQANLTLSYSWIENKEYTLELLVVDNRTTELKVKAPTIMPSVDLEIGNITVIKTSNTIQVSAMYNATGYGTEELQTILFTYLSYKEQDRSIYLFYDKKYMADESIRRADAIISHFSTYNMSIRKVDFPGLSKLAKEKPKIVLILITPLKDRFGKGLPDALPAPLIDPNMSGSIKDDSTHSKSFLYDWMKDNGLVLVTIGSLEPYKRILKADGSYVSATDSVEQFDAERFLTDANLTATPYEKMIKGGKYMYGSYSSVRISDTLGLSNRQTSFYFDKDVLRRYNISYYGYGDYSLPSEKGFLNLTLPAYLKVGEGGWLAMDDDELSISDNDLAHDLFLIFMQAPWNSMWIPYGWYWDSCGNFTVNPYGMIRSGGILETEAMPFDLFQDKITIRIVCIARSRETGKGIITEQMITPNW